LATASIVAMASPELYPADALPLILAAVKPLKWGRMSGPDVHCVVTTDDSGTIWLLALRV
jgi:hypothetical protein